MMDVIWIGSFTPGGIGRAGTDYVRIIKEHITPNIRVIGMNGEYEGASNINKPYAVFIHGLPGNWEMNCKQTPYIETILKGAEKKIKVTAWETTPIPYHFETDLTQNYDVICVPSAFCKESFRDQSKVVILPHLVQAPPSAEIPNIDIERYDPKCINLFASVSQMTSRKGIDLLIKLVQLLTDHAEFSWNLYINVPSYIDGVSMRNIIDKDAVNNRVHIITTRLTDMNIWSMYEKMDCVINLSRGEGFGYTYHDPVRVGTRTLVPETHGTQSLWINKRDHHLYIPYTYSWVKVDSSTYQSFNIPADVSDSYWIEPNLDSVMSQLNKYFGSLRLINVPEYRNEKATVRYEYDNMADITRTLTEILNG